MFDGEPTNSDRRTRDRATDGYVPAPDIALQNFKYIRHYIRSGRLPWRRVSTWKKEDLCNSAFLNASDVGERNGIPFPLRDHRFVSNKTFQRCLKNRFRDEIRDASTHLLKQADPKNSASSVFSFGQKVLLVIVIAALSWALVTYPLATVIGLNSIITAYFIMAIVYRIVLLAVGAPGLQKKAPAIRIPTEDLPVITILLPLYRDAASLAPLSRAIDALEYPPEKKDVKLLLEADDTETMAEAKRLGLHDRYEMISVPRGGPRTKPKACNYGMHLARGDLIVIYDAEDQPESDQLLKAAQAFHKKDRSLACVQARLNYYNASENWLTRLFTLEYSLWFDWLLPGLQRLRAPIPLGGTSNFLRTETLLEVGGWDPYNVTEDADLGMRLSKLGYRVEILDSTTFEEANCRTGNWIRQRSRWMKGYLQTWIVHMRRPSEIIKTTGWSGFLSFQLFVAGNFFSALVNPVLWVVFALWSTTHAEFISAAFPGPLLWLNMFALVFGNLFFMLLAVIAPMKRKWFSHSIFGFSAPLYWLLTSVAAYKAIWQIIFRPHYWEKTDHVISEIAVKRRDAALSQYETQKANAATEDRAHIEG